MLPALASRSTILYAVGRRRRSGSSDFDPYAIKRESEDVAAAAIRSANRPTRWNIPMVETVW